MWMDQTSLRISEAYEVPINNGVVGGGVDSRIEGKYRICEFDVKAYLRYIYCQKPFPPFPLRFSCPSSDIDWAESKEKKILEKRERAEQADLKRKAELFAEIEGELKKKTKHEEGDK